MPDKLSDVDRRALWEQFVETYAHVQEAYDSSVRTLAAAGVAVTVSLATALEDLSGAGFGAVFLFLGSLFCNLCSYWTAQLDMRARLKSLREKGTYEGAEGNAWTVATHLLNVAAGAALIAGGLLLAVFVASTV